MAGAGDERGTAPEKSISGAAGAGVRTACTADYAGDHAEEENTGSVCHALADAATNRFDTAQSYAMTGGMS